MKKRSLEDELKDRYERWEHLKQYGGSDPFWEDGGNMNLVRNHIISIKREMAEQGIESELLNREIPPETDNMYMARADEIRKNANIALAEYKANPDYKYLLSTIDKLNKRQVEQTSIINVINYCKGLESFIEKDDLVAMRRHEKYERYLQSFWDCKKRVEKVLGEQEEELGQMSIMDFIGV